jgi:hypothetical protein
MFLQAAVSPAGDRLQTLALSRFGTVRAAKSGPRSAANRRENNRRARREMEGFRRALSSYPARFAQDPKMTFEKHCRSVMAEAVRSRELD